MKNVYFITAIGTDSGKTIISAILCRALNADYWKPVQSGEPGDSEEIARLTDGKVTIHPERYRLKLPASPHLSAAEEDVQIRLKDFTLPVTDNLVVEGAGGMMVPLNNRDLIIDLAEQWQIPIILVCNIYLGSINHSLLSISYLKSRNLKVAGIIFNGPETPSTESIIESYCPWPVLIRIRPADPVASDWISDQAKKLRQVIS